MFIRNLFLTYATELFMLGLNFLTGILLARLLPPAERGILALVMGLPLILVAFVHLGIPQASVYLIGREKRPARQVAGNAVALSLGIGTLTGLAIFILREPVGARLLGGLEAAYVALVAGLIPFALTNGTLLGLLSAGQRFDRYNLQRLAGTLAQLVGFLALIWLGRGGVAAGIGVFAGVVILGMFFSAWLVWRDLPAWPRLDWQTARDMLRFGLKSYLQFLFGNLAFRLDLYLIALFLPAEQAAYYSVAVSLAELVWILADSAGMILYPHLTNAPLAQAGKITAQVLRGVVTLSAGMALVLLLAGGWLLPFVYGPAYQNSVPAFVALLPGILLMSIYKVLARYFTSLNRQKFSIIASGRGLVLIVGLDLWLIPLYGIVGAAWISSAGYGLSGLVLLGFFMRQNGLSAGECLVLERQEWKAAAGFVGRLPGRILGRTRPT